jgi:hypothetical protein
MTYPTVPLNIRIRIAPYAVDRTADPATYTWTDITSKVHHLYPITDTIGANDDASEGNTDFGCTLKNDDGAFTTDNPESPYYPYFDLGCPIEYALDSGGGFVVQCYTFLGTAENDWPSNTPYKCIAEITAGGQFQRLGLDPPIASPVKRMLLSRKHKAIWMFEDKAGSTAAASAYPQQGPMTALAGVPPEFGQSPLVDGVSSMVKFSTGTNLSAFLNTPTQTSGARISFLLHVGTAPAGQTSLVALYGTEGASINRYILELGTGNLKLSAYNATNVEIAGAAFIGFTAHLTDCVWVDLSITGTTPGFVAWDLRETTWKYNADGTIFSSVGFASGSFAGTYGAIAAVSFGPLRDIDDVYVAAANLTELPSSVTLLGGTAAVLSWAGNKATERVQGMCAEFGVPYHVTSPTLGSVMGPQLTDSLLANMRNIQKTDHGVLTDHLGVIDYRALSELYNLAPSISLSKSVKGQLGQLDPVRDDATKTNITGATRTGGSTATAMDQVDVIRSGPYERQPIEVNVLTDGVLPGHAGWALARGASRGYRYASLSLNLRVAAETTPALPGQVMALKLGDRIAMTSLPQQAGKDGITRMVTGRTQTVLNRGMGGWDVEYRLVPTEPYDAYILNTSRLDASGAELIQAAAPTDTILMASMPEVTAAVAGPGLGIPLTIEGERVTLDTVANETYIDTFTRVVANGVGSIPATAHLAAQAWSISGGAAADYAATGSAATLTMTAAGTSRQLHLVGMVLTNWDMTAFGSFAVTPTGANLELQLAYRTTASAGYQVRATIDTSNNIRLQLFAPGVFDPIADVLVTLTHSASVVYGFHVLCVGTRHRVKLWQGNAAAEPLGPYAWQIDVQDDTRLAPGYPVVRAGRAVGNTNAGAVATWDNFTINNVQAFTVIRSVNGVVKTLPARGAIHVTTARGLGI